MISTLSLATATSEDDFLFAHSLSQSLGINSLI